MEWEGIQTRIIETWITEKDNKLDDKTWTKFLEDRKKDLENPPKKAHKGITNVFLFVIVIWILIFMLSIIPIVQC